MFSVNETSDTFTCVFSSRLHLVDRCIEDIKGFVRSEHIGSNTCGLELASRELLLNAVIHGNKNDLEKCVICTVERKTSDLYCITVIDQGDGFDLDSINPKSQFSAGDEHLRGLTIVNSHADSLTVNKSEKSVKICVKIQLLKPVIIKDIPEGILIIPQTDLTASCVDQFKNILLECVNKNPQKIKFDFSHIVTIDSICLCVFSLLIRSINSNGSKTVLEIIHAGKELEDLFWLTRLTDKFRFLKGEIDE
jgi:anti-sigma regulatory factor (Ser/Thr protein kinase)/anti-anti-sigma regulatory factor